MSDNLPRMTLIRTPPIPRWRKFIFDLAYEVEYRADRLCRWAERYDEGVPEPMPGTTNPAPNGITILDCTF